MAKAKKKPAKNSARKNGVLKSAHRAGIGAAGPQWGQLNITVTCPRSGAQNCNPPCNVSGTFPGATITDLSAVLILPNGTSQPLSPDTTVQPPSWQFNYPTGLPQPNTQYSVVIYSASNPGTAVVIAFSCNGPSLAVNSVVTGSPGLTLTGLTSATGLASGGPNGAEFTVMQLPNGTFGVTGQLQPGASSLQLYYNDPVLKFVNFPAVDITYLQSAPGDPHVTVQYPSTLQLVWPSPMAQNAFAPGIYTLQGPGGTMQLANPVQLDFHTLTLTTNDGSTFTQGSQYTLSIGNVTDQAGNAYAAGAVNFTAQ